MEDLIQTIGMKILHGPVSVYCDRTGNRGITAFAIIETSHIALHIWDEQNPALLQLDVYTCSSLSVETVIESMSIFRPMKIHYKFLDREQGFEEITDTPQQVVGKWVSRISRKQLDLDDHSICPFARMPRVRATKKLSISDFIGLDDDITVYMEDGIYSTYTELENLCKHLKELSPNYVFLPDHPEKKTFIGEYETGNGIFPCIIVQTKKELHSARAALSKTSYYDHWDPDYLSEIRSFD
jgi:S-adenosylmethionine/arginine decarboxylase-like enzyme